MAYGAPHERVTVAQAAERLGISQPAVRARIRRGSLRADHTPDGVRVYVTPDATPRGTSEHLADLRAAIEAERRAHGETRRLLAAALERIPPALPAGDTAAQDADTPTTPAAAYRPWWRRVFRDGP
jgi:DNA-binding Lrp family transcriptional regulator